MSSTRHRATTLQDFLRARRRVAVATLVLLLVMGIGSAGYWYLATLHPELAPWTFWDCIYMTAVTVTTVGFGEVIDVSAVPGGRPWTLVLLMFGITANLFVVSSITTFFVEGDFDHLRLYGRQFRKMKNLENHFIVCGVGTTGTHVAAQLRAGGHQVVVIDTDPDHLETVHGNGIFRLIGDATEDEVLQQAGLERARGIVAALDDDKTNMFVVVSARQANPGLRIVAKAVTPSAEAKLRRAGADSVVSPNRLGGNRLAAELVKPSITRFLDAMLQGHEPAALRLDEAVIGQDGPMTGQTFGDADLQEKTGALVVAVRSRGGKVRHAPASDAEIIAGQTLIVLGTANQVLDLRHLVGHPDA